MTTQKLLAPLRRAVDDYNMINDGDKIAVGLSGGKDSLALLALLKAFQKFSPNKFELIAITIDLGFNEGAFEPVVEYCKQLEVEYILEPTNIGDVIFNIRKESNPCSLCSKMRRGALNTILLKNGYNKLALGHHADDALETLLLSFMYEGRLSTFAPVSFMDRTEVTMIRPMIYIDEIDLASYSKKLPVVVNPCPANKNTQREYMKNLIKHIQKEIPFARERMIGALTHPERNNLWKKPK